MALVTAALVFSVASRDHRPASIALAAAAGYGGFALGLVVLAARGLYATVPQRLGFALASFVPVLWAGALALAACASVGAGSGAAPLLLSCAVVVAYLPVLWWFGRGVGLGRLARGWLAGRKAGT
jgi:hypothetical protein